MTDNPDEETQKYLREFFGMGKRPRKPFPSDTFNTLCRIYSLCPGMENHPLAQYAKLPQYSHVPVWPRWATDKEMETLYGVKSDDASKDDVREDDPCKDDVPRSVLVNLSRVEAGNSSSHNEGNRCGTDGAFSGVKMMVDDLRRKNNGEAVEKIAIEDTGNGGTNVRITEINTVSDDLLDIERLLMDESDDLGMEGPDKDVSLDLANNFDFFLDLNMSVKKSLTGGSSECEELTVGRITKEDVVNKRKGKDVEVNIPMSEVIVGASQAHHSVGRGMSSCQDVVNKDASICLENSRNKERRQKAPQELSGTQTPIAARIKNAGEVSTGKSLDNSTEGYQFGTVAKGATNAGKTGERTFVKDLGLGKHQHNYVDDGASISRKSGNGTPMILSNTLKRNAAGILKSSLSRKDEKSWPHCRARLTYTREQLLHLSQMASTSEDMMKAVREIEAQLHVRDQIPTASELIDAIRFNKEQLRPKENKESKEKASGILKTDKRGTSSEARKEKKKVKKRIKRAETNRKLGVSKRLKIKPMLKPKVVQHCRHYLKGRCHEGEKCKFSHDVVPLTKSKPCCHFARQACMKGEDCPFDHQLSKYPCINYVDTGFCGRGVSCLFSHKTAAMQGGNTGGANVQPDIVVGFTSHLRNTVVDVPALSRNQGIGCPLPERTSGDSSGDGKRLHSPTPMENNPSYVSSGRPLESNSSKQNFVEDLLKNTPRTIGGTVGNGTQLNRGLSSGALKLAEIYKGTPTPVIAKGITLLTSDGHATEKSGGKSVGVLAVNKETEQTNIQEKVGASVSEKSKEIQPDLRGSQSSSSQVRKADLSVKNAPSVSEKSKEIQPDLQGFQSSSNQLTKVDPSVKNVPSNSQRSLESVLTFAAKYESRIKKSTVDASAATASGSKQLKPSQASTILEFLYGGVDKEKQRET